MKRNRYQKALKRMRQDYLNNQNSDCDVLEELVEKATPKKVIKLKKEQYGYTHQCPICEQLVGTIVMSRNNEFSPYIEENDYCCSCGQALDWSDDQ